MAERELKERLRRIGAGRAGPALVEMKPASAYEAVTRQMVEALADELKEIKGRLNGLLWMVGGAMVLDVAMRLMGSGS